MRYQKGFVECVRNVQCIYYYEERETVLRTVMGFHNESSLCACVTEKAEELEDALVFVQVRRLNYDCKYLMIS